MQSELEQLRSRKRKSKSKAGAPRWMVGAVAVLSLAVIFLGLGITAMVVMLERERAQNTAGGDAPIAAVEQASDDNQDPAQITILTPTSTPQPTSTPIEVTPTTVVNPTAEPTASPIVVDREELADLSPIVVESPAPVVTATVLPAGGVAAPRVNVPFVIDGDLEGWANIASTVSAYNVYNQTWWDESNDLDAFWRLAWDSINLYVGVVIVDDLHVQTQQALTAYRGDSLELQIDTDLAGDPNTLINTDDFQLVLSPGDFNTIAPSAFRFRGTDQNRMEGLPGHSIVVSAVKTDTGYVLEAAIPWDDLDLRPMEDLVIGISLNANDNDLIDAAVQEMMKSQVATRTFDDPSTWGTLVLTGN